MRAQGAQALSWMLQGVVLLAGTSAVFAASAVSSQLRDSPADSFYVTAYINVTYRDDKGGLRSDRSEIAKFGDGRVGTARGLLVHTKSAAAPGACALPLVRAPSAANGQQQQLPTEPWIALIRRGHCTFDMKVHNAALSKAVAVIVYDDKESDSLDMMDISPEHNITAVLTYRWKGEHLAKLADSGSKVYVEISVANRCARALNSINRTSVLFVSVSFIVLMIISLAWLVFYYVQRFRYIHAKDRLSRRMCSAARRALSKIPTRRLKIDDPELAGEGDCCAICIERYRVAEVIRALPCRHDFHKPCIDPWLLEHRTCPMCKMDILKHYGFVFTGSQESILHLDFEEVVAYTFGLDPPNPQRDRQREMDRQRRQQQQHQQHSRRDRDGEEQAPAPELEPATQPAGSSTQSPPDPQPQQHESAEQGQGKDQSLQGPNPAAGSEASLDLQRPESPGSISSSSSSTAGYSVTVNMLPQSDSKRPHILSLGCKPSGSIRSPADC